MPDRTMIAAAPRAVNARENPAHGPRPASLTLIQRLKRHNPSGVVTVMSAMISQRVWESRGPSAGQ